MYTSEIANKYGVDKEEFEQFLIDASYPYKKGLLGMSLNTNIEEAVIKFKKIKAKEYEYHEIERKKRANEELQRQIALDSMLITSGFSFEGYKIIHYSEYISCDYIIHVTNSLYNVVTVRPTQGQGLANSLKEIRRDAISKLKVDAYDLDCNAIIGVDFNYTILEAGTHDGHLLPAPLVVTAKGNAVVIQKTNE